MRGRRSAAHIPDMAQQTREKDKGRSAHGGRYASHERPDGQVSLTSDGEMRVPATAPVNEADALRIAKTIAQRKLWHTQNVIDPEDVAQDAVLSLLRTAESNPRENLFTGGLINTAVGNAVAVALNNQSGRRWEDFAALGKFTEKVEQAETAIERHLTSKELDELATKIRDNWHNPRHKPTVGYHLPPATVDSLSDEGTFLEAEYIPLGADDDGRQTGADDLAYELENGAIKKSDAAGRLWNALAESRTELPTTRPGTMRASHVRTHRQNLPNLRVAANAYLDGTATEAQTSSLFAPWGSTSVDDRTAVAELLVSHPEKVAAGLWKSAATAASVPAPRSIADDDVDNPAFAFAAF